MLRRVEASTRAVRVCRLPLRRLQASTRAVRVCRLPLRRSLHGGALGGQRLHELLCDRHNPAAVAVVSRHGDTLTTMTYGELRERSLRLAHALHAADVRSGDRVGVLLPKIPEVHVCAVALARLGAVYLPLFTAFGASAARERLASAGVAAVITTGDQREKVPVAGERGHRPTFTLDGNEAGDACLRAACEEAPPLAEERHEAWPSLLALLFTSGTTGAPKGVPVQTRALESFEVYMREGLAVDADARFWNAADPGWAYGLYYNVYGILLLGQTAHLLGGAFCPRATLDFMAENGITHFAAAPTAYRALRASGAPVPPSLRVRVASSAGEPLQPAVSDWFEHAFGVPIRDQYGQTEVGMCCVNHHAGDRALPRAEVRARLDVEAPFACHPPSLRRCRQCRWACRCAASSWRCSAKTARSTSRAPRASWRSTCRARRGSSSQASPPPGGRRPWLSATSLVSSFCSRRLLEARQARRGRALVPHRRQGALRAGSRWHARVRLERPEGRRHPGGGLSDRPHRDRGAHQRARLRGRGARQPRSLSHALPSDAKSASHVLVAGWRRGCAGRAEGRGAPRASNGTTSLLSVILDV
jgi:hypothetical protein